MSLRNADQILLALESTHRTFSLSPRETHGTVMNLTSLGVSPASEVAKFFMSSRVPRPGSTVRDLVMASRTEKSLIGLVTRPLLVAWRTTDDMNTC